MSKADILAELPKLTPGDRDEIFHELWLLTEKDAHQNGPSAEEKTLLDEELADFQLHPNDGSSWSDVQARLLRRK